MSEYLVTIPIAGVVSVVVEADSEHEAKNKAYGTEWDLDGLSKGIGDMQLDELDLYEMTHEGNVCYLPQWNIEAEEQ